MAEKERLKLEFDFLKGLFYIVLVAFFGNISYIFTKNLGFFMYVLSFFSIGILGYILLKTYIRINIIFKKG